MKSQAMKLRGELREQEPLSRHTSWRTGGTAQHFYLPADAEDLAVFLQQIDESEPLFWLGLGSNLLVRDGGIKGTVICTNGVMNEIKMQDDQHVQVDVGVACPKFARFTAKQGLSGAEFLCGIPGTIGGALALNAGALGSETWDMVEKVQTIDRYGNLNWRSSSEFEVSYRSVKSKFEEWFVRAVFRLQAGQVEQSLEKIRANLARRAATQPTQQPNAGSVFRNPPGDYAARLIEACGLKGFCVGGACVSEKHANFIINTGTASSADIETLIDLVALRVKQEQGIQLIREVHIVGEAL